MQQGRLLRTVPVCLLLCLLLFLLFSHLGLPQPGRWAPFHSVIAPAGITGPSGSNRPIIIEKLPPLPGLVQPAQGPGPIPDDDLTATGLSTDELDPTASPAGTQSRIAFVTTGLDLDGDNQIDPTLPDDPNFTPHFNIWIMRADGSEQIQITDLAGDEREPAYDPSGHLFAYSSNVTGTWQIYTVEISSGLVQQITTGAGNKRHPTWSTDGRWIAFACDADGNWNIYRINSRGVGTPSQLTTSPGDETAPAWQPGGNTIAYTGEVGGTCRIYTMTPEGTNVTCISSGGGDPATDDIEPGWQRNGTTLAFSSNRLTGGGDTVRDYNIWRMTSLGELEGPEATLLSSTDPADAGDDVNPYWTPPLERQPLRVIFESNRANIGENNIDIWRHIIQDTRPPVLDDLPSVDNRLPAPGSDITVSVPVHDKEPGVAAVRAIFKNPDIKLYMAYYGWGWYDTNFLEGDKYLEWDCMTVDSVELTDPDGDGTFSGTWTTPLTARDYIIDILVMDNAGNSLTYDDIYGFSTEVFSPQHNILFVNDYCEGQSFLALLGLNNDYPAWFPVESYYTSNPSDHPDVYNVEYDTISGYFGKNYDVWRVICRGRIPPSVYQYYLSTIEYQLEPAEAVSDPVGAQPTREVRVADRMIVWAAPHTGDVWVGEESGSVVDARVQTDLGLFLDRGGNLIISGHDIAWALTMNGTITNSFLSNHLKAQFVADTPCAAIGYYASIWVWIPGGGWWRMQNTAYGFTATGAEGDPVTDANWVPRMDCRLDADERPRQLKSPKIPNPGDPNPIYEDAAEWSLYPDHIQVLGNATKLYGYGAPDSHSFAGPPAGLRYDDPTTGAHLIYLAFGLEQIHRGYHQTTPACTGVEYKHCKNHRSHLIDNTYIWMCTGTFQGRVLSIKGGQPLLDPNPIVKAKQGGTVRYAVRCQDDGTYVMNGILPGWYQMEAYRRGYDIDHYDQELTHASLGPVIVDFVLTHAQPGAIAGTVTSEATGDFLANVQITVYEALPIEEEEEEVEGTQTAQADEEEYERGAEKGSTLTAADGTYDVGGLMAGFYFVEANGNAIGYDSEERLVEVTVGNTTTADFVLTAADGILQVTVRDGETLAPLADASVEVFVAGEDEPVAAAATDEDGVAEIGIQPGTYQVIGEASGYERSAPVPTLVESVKTTQITIDIERQPPGSLSGKVVSATTGNPVGDVLVKILYNEQVIATTTTAGTLTDPGDGSELYNYIFTDVPTGTVTVRPDPVGFTAQPTERRVRVVSGQRTTGVNFQLSSLHTFPAGMQLMSVPFGYEMTDPAQLLQVPAAELLLATWQPERMRYRLYPQAPADRLRLGVGYWLKLATVSDLRQEGTRPLDPTLILVQPGWNIIGDPFNEIIDLYTIEVEDQAGTVQSLSAAMAAGKLQGTLFAYVLGGYRAVAALSPYAGYWFRAYEPLTLHVSESAGALSAAQVAQRPAVPPPADGWLLPLEVSAGGCVDASTYLGQAVSATAGYDIGKDMEKPPAVDFGPYVYAAFEHDNDSSYRGNYAVDIRPEGQGTWTLAVHTNLTQTPVTIRWPDMSGVPDQVRLMLTDEAAGRHVYMRTASGYQYTAREPVRHLRITAEDGSRAGELMVSGLTATAAGGRRASIVYSLSQPAQVWVEVRNISGALVRQVGAGRVQSAGQQIVLWDGCNQAGVAVPGGQYLVKVTAVTDQGRRSSALSSFTLYR